MVVECLPPQTPNLRCGQNGNHSHMVIYFRLYSSFTTRVTNGVFADAVSEDDDTAWATV